MTFKIGRTPAVKGQIRELAKAAKARRIYDSFIDSLQHSTKQLEERPAEWGDPEYDTKLKGGVVYHGIAWPLIVRYALYQAQQVVFILDISPLSQSPLAGGS